MVCAFFCACNADTFASASFRLPCKLRKRILRKISTFHIPKLFSVFRCCSSTFFFTRSNSFLMLSLSSMASSSFVSSGKAAYSASLRIRSISSTSFCRLSTIVCTCSCLFSRSPVPNSSRNRFAFCSDSFVQSSSACLMSSSKVLYLFSSSILCWYVSSSCISLSRFVVSERSAAASSCIVYALVISGHSFFRRS